MLANEELARSVRARWWPDTQAYVRSHPLIWFLVLAFGAGADAVRTSLGLQSPHWLWIWRIGGASVPLVIAAVIVNVTAWRRAAHDLDSKLRIALDEPTMRKAKRLRTVRISVHEVKLTAEQLLIALVRRGSTWADWREVVHLVLAEAHASPTNMEGVDTAVRELCARLTEAGAIEHDTSSIPHNPRFPIIHAEHDRYRILAFATELIDAFYTMTEIAARSPSSSASRADFP